MSHSVPALHRLATQKGIWAEGCRQTTLLYQKPWGLPHCCPEAATAARSGSVPKMGGCPVGGSHPQGRHRFQGAQGRGVWERPISDTGRAAKGNGLRCQQQPTLRAPLRWRPRRPAARGGAEPGRAGCAREASCRVPAPRRSPRTRPPCAAAASRAAPSPSSSRSRSPAVAMSFLL